MTIPYGSLTWRQGDRGMSTICWRLWSEVLWSWNLHSGRFDQPKTLETSQIKPPNWEIGWTLFGVLLAHLAWFERLGISTTWTKNGMWGRWFNPYSASSWLDFQGQEFIYHLTLNRTNINPHEKLKGWNLRLVSSMFIKILDIQEDEIKQYKTCIITRSHFECFALNICVFVWLAFGFWCHILGGGFKHFSPTALALGSSGIVKVSGQNCLRQIRLGPPGGSTKVSPRFSKFRCVSGSLGQKVLWKVPPSLL